MKNIFAKIFSKTKSKKNSTFTIINENRKSQVRHLFNVKNKKERQDSCLSKYFENIKGLNQIERNIYSKTF